MVRALKLWFSRWIFTANWNVENLMGRYFDPIIIPQQLIQPLYSHENNLFETLYIGKMDYDFYLSSRFSPTILRHFCYKLSLFFSKFVELHVLKVFLRFGRFSPWYSYRSYSYKKAFMRIKRFFQSCFLSEEREKIINILIKNFNLTKRSTFFTLQYDHQF